jgi:hypothetical protein
MSNSFEQPGLVRRMKGTVLESNKIPVQQKAAGDYFQQVQQLSC